MRHSKFIVPTDPLSVGESWVAVVDVGDASLGQGQWEVKVGNALSEIMLWSKERGRFEANLSISAPGQYNVSALLLVRFTTPST